MTTPGRYPSWAPKDLCELDATYQVTPNALFRDFYWPDRSKSDQIKAIGIIRALIVDTRMESVWQTLQERSERLGVEGWARRLVTCCLEAIARYDAAPRTTPAERKKRLNAIAGQAFALAEALADSPSLLIRNPRISDLLDSGDMATPEGRSFLSVREFVVRLGERVAVEAQRGDAPVEMPQPKARDAARRFFICLLSYYFQSVYKTPLHEYVAMITEVVFNMPHNSVQPDTVRILVARTRRKEVRKSKR